MMLVFGKREKVLMLFVVMKERQSINKFFYEYIKQIVTETTCSRFDISYIDKDFSMRL